MFSSWDPLHNEQGCGLPVAPAARLSQAQGAGGKQGGQALGRRPAETFPTILDTVLGGQTGRSLEHPTMRREVLESGRVGVQSQLHTGRKGPIGPSVSST